MRWSWTKRRFPVRWWRRIETGEAAAALLRRVGDPNGRYGPPSGFVAAPLGTTSSAPPEPTVTVDEKSVTIRWTAAPDARGVTEPADPELLPSKPIVPGPPPTTYDVYEVSRNASPDGP